MWYGRHVWKGISYEYMWVCVDDAVSTCLCVCVPYPFCAVNLNYGLAGNNGRSCLIFLSTSVRLLGWLELWIVLLAWVGVRCCWVCVWFGGIILLLGFPAWLWPCVCGDWIEDWCYLTLGLLCLSMLYQFFRISNETSHCGYNRRFCGR